MATEVNRLLEEQQTGQFVPDEDEKKNQEAIKNTKIEIPKPGPGINDARIRPGNKLITGESNVAQEAAEAGWGESRYDVGEFVPGMNLENKRAIEQSGFAKIGTGLMKGGVTAAATAVNTTIGTVFGAGSALFEFANESGGDKKGMMDVVDAGVNNYISTQMTKLQQWSEKAFPNYRTTEEQSDEYQKEWFKHILTPNFIGDSILKNFGFTVGAIGGGALWTKGLSTLMRAGLANSLMKGVVVSAEGNPEANAALQKALGALRAGNATVADTEVLVNNIQNAGRQLNRMNARLQLYGSAIGAMGEGTMEGQMAKQEFLDGYINDLNQKYINDVNALEQQLIDNWKDTDLVRAIAKKDENGQVHVSYELNDAGRALFEEEKSKISRKYIDERESADQFAERLASTTFLLNLPILTTSNAVQFGKLFSGGWKTARNVKGLEGGISLTPRVLEGTEYAAPKIAGEYIAKNNPAISTVLNSLKVAGTESFEEMSQGAISSGAKQVASNDVAEFNNDGFDAGATDSVREWFEAMYSGGKEYLGDIKNWQEGFLGALTGLFGIPGKFWKGQWNGGLIGAAKDAKREAGAAREAAELLNRKVNSQDFQDRWHGYIRHLKYDQQMADAVEKDNEYAWHDANSKQLINDVIDFADRGKLEDLRALVDSYSNLSQEQAEYLKPLLVTDKKVKSDISNAEVIERVKERANDLNEAINLYETIDDAVTSLLPAGSDPKLRKEALFTAMQMKGFEKRFLELYDKTMKEVKPRLNMLRAYKNADDDVKAETLDILGNVYRDIFSEIRPIKLDPRLINETDKALNDLKSVVKDDKQLLGQINDLEKLANARRDFYSKYMYLQTPGGAEAFNQAAVTAQTIADMVTEAADNELTKNLNSIDAMHTAFAESKDKGGLVSALRTKAKSDKNAADFVKLFDTYNDFRTHILDNYQNLVSKDTGSIGEMAEVVLNNLFKNSKNATELIDNLAAGKFNKAEFDRELDRMVEAKELSDEFAIPVLRDDQFNKITSSLQSAAQEFKTAWKDTQGKDVVNSDATVEQKQKTSPAPKTDDSPEPSTMSQNPVEKKDGVEVKSEPAKENPTEVKEEVEEKEPANPSQKEEISDSLSSYSDDTISEDDAQVTDVKGDTRLGYYQQSIPEIEIFDGKTNIFEKVKNWINELKNTNSKERISQINNELRNSVRDFVIGHPDYADIYNWLKDKGAFEYISTKLNVNDKLVFYTTDECPKYNDKMQIVVGVVKARNADGEISDIQPLTTLHLANSVSSSNRTKYAYLDELYDAMRKDFTSQEPNGGMWVFGGRKTPITSNVFAIRPGLIPLGGESKDIKQIPGYSESAPIIQYSFDGTPQVLRGTINDISRVFLPTRSNLKPGETRAGYLYYLVRNGNDTFTPVALHINNMDRYKEIGRDINKAIEEGIIESDVQMLRQKGVNFMFDPWNPKTGKFGRLLGDINTSQQVNYDAELGEVNREERDKKVAEDEKIPFNNLAEREGQTSVQEETSSTSLSIENKNYSELSGDEKAKVDAKGIPSDVWDTSNASDRKKLLGC